MSTHRANTKKHDMCIGLRWGDPDSAKFKVTQLMVLDKGG